MRFLLFIAMFFSLTVPASAEMVKYSFTDGWLVSRDSEGDFCIAMTSYEGGDFAGFIIFPNGGTKMMFADPNVTSLKKDEKVELDLYFIDKLKNIDDGWGKQSFTTFDLSDSKALVSDRLDKQVLKDIARSEKWAVMKDGKIIEMYRLEGSAVAVNQAMRCIGLNPEDPFLK